MFWVEIDNLEGWLVKVQNEMVHFPQFAIVKEHLYDDIWRTYPSGRNEEEAIENVEKLNNNREFNYSEYNIVYHYPRKSLIPVRQVIVKSNKTAAPESYTDISDVDQSDFKNLNFWHWEEKDLPFPLDKYPGEVTHEYKNKPKVYRELDDYPNQAYDGVQASLKNLSWALSLKSEKEKELLERIARDTGIVGNKLYIYTPSPEQRSPEYIRYFLMHDWGEYYILIGERSDGTFNNIEQINLSKSDFFRGLSEEEYENKVQEFSKFHTEFYQNIFSQHSSIEEFMNTYGDQFYPTLELYKTYPELKEYIDSHIFIHPEGYMRIQTDTGKMLSMDKSLYNYLITYNLRDKFKIMLEKTGNSTTPPILNDIYKDNYDILDYDDKESRTFLRLLKRAKELGIEHRENYPKLDVIREGIIRKVNQDILSVNYENLDPDKADIFFRRVENWLTHLREFYPALIFQGDSSLFRELAGHLYNFIPYGPIDEKKKHMINELTHSNVIQALYNIIAVIEGQKNDYRLAKLSWQEKPDLDIIIQHVFKELKIPLSLKDAFYYNIIFSNESHKLLSALEHGNYETIKDLVQKWKTFKKLSWNELPNAEEIIQYDINPLTEINLYPTRDKEDQDVVKYRNQKEDAEILFEKGLHETTDRSETERDLIPYAKLSWQLKDSDALASIKKGEIWKGVFSNSAELYILPIENPGISFDNTSYPYIFFYGFDGADIKDLEQEFQNRSPHYIAIGGRSLKSLDNVREVKWEKIGDYKDVFSFLKLSWQEPDNLTGWLVKKYREVGTPLYGVVVKDEYNEEDDFPYIYARWGDTEEQALSSFNHYGWESFQDKDSIFMYVKPNKDFPLKIKEAHTTVVYLNNSIKEEDRENIIKDISNLLKDYKKPKLFFTGIATFDDEDKSRVILVNFENGAKLYSNLISILSKYIDIDRNYDFIPHMTINKDLEIEELPDYNWKPNVLYIEFSKDIPATMIEFETGKVSCTQRLVESSQKLSWNIDTRVYNFENELKKQNISFYKENNTYIIDHNGDVNLFSLEQLPDNIQFNNGGNVYLHSLTQLPNNIQFNNRGHVDLFSLKQLPDNIQFNNGGSVYLNSLEQLPDNIQFNNGGSVNLNSLEQLPDNIQFNNGDYVYLNSLRQLPDNKYEIFKNKRIVKYDDLSKVFNPNMKLFAGYTAIL